MSSTKNNFKHGDIVWYGKNRFPYQIVVVDNKRIDIFWFKDGIIHEYSSEGLGYFNSMWRLATPAEIANLTKTPPIPIPNQITNSYELY